MMTVECKICNATADINGKSLAAIKKSRALTKQVDAFFIAHFHDGRYDPKCAFTLKPKDEAMA